jgi:hypothetical protein
VFHGPRRIALYSAQGVEIAQVPTGRSVTPCSPQSRRGLATAERAAAAQRRPALTASARAVRSICDHTSIVLQLIVVIAHGAIAQPHAIPTSW